MSVVRQIYFVVCCANAIQYNCTCDLAATKQKSVCNWPRVSDRASAGERERAVLVAAFLQCKKLFYFISRFKIQLKVTDNNSGGRRSPAEAEAVRRRSQFGWTHIIQLKWKKSLLGSFLEQPRANNRSRIRSPLV